jgi:hypothetical protein
MVVQFVQTTVYIQCTRSRTVSIIGSLLFHSTESTFSFTSSMEKTGARAVFTSTFEPRATERTVGARDLQVKTGARACFMVADNKMHSGALSLLYIHVVLC